MRVLYITAQIPWGSGEAFVFPEIEAFRARGIDVRILPLRPARKIASSKEAFEASGFSEKLPLFGIRTFILAFRTLARHPYGAARAVAKLLAASGNLVKALKNMVIVPKGLAVASVVERLQPDHIHAHWASTPSSAAFIAAEITSTPWSFTAHRWDIQENNALALKASSAEFTRTISIKGLSWVRELVPAELHDRIVCIHMGVKIADSNGMKLPRPATPKEPTIMVCPANLLPVKGHYFLLEALAILRQSGVSFQCKMLGDGPLREVLEAQTAQLGLGDVVQWMGHIPHERLLEMYSDDSRVVVVLPSIVTDEGAQEGIPVSLMEAMAAGVPVVSTETGGIPELLSRGAGLLVPPGRPDELAKALCSLVQDDSLYREIVLAGLHRVMQEFSVEASVSKLSERILGPPEGKRKL